MIRWRKLEAGHYESVDGRFDILASYSRLYGNHWVLQDSYEKDYYKGQYHECTLRDCKLKAETLADIRKRFG